MDFTDRFTTSKRKCGAKLHFIRFSSPIGAIHTEKIEYLRKKDAIFWKLTK
ncbi:MAG: hypothetical protein GY820_40260 [Gammaproteobacteria bacterium]|nr:hypothetical protein [Gammaproteobacteria bacterium]